MTADGKGHTHACSDEGCCIGKGGVAAAAGLVGHWPGRSDEGGGGEGGGSEGGGGEGGGGEGGGGEGGGGKGGGGAGGGGDGGVESVVVANLLACVLVGQTSAADARAVLLAGRFAGVEQGLALHPHFQQ